MIAADADTIRAMEHLGGESAAARAIAAERGCSVRAVQISLARLREGGVVAQVGDRWAARWVLLVPHERAHRLVAQAVMQPRPQRRDDRGRYLPIEGPGGDPP